MSSLDCERGVADFVGLLSLVLRSCRLEEREDEEALDAGGGGLVAGGAPRAERRTSDGMVRVDVLRVLTASDWCEMYWKPLEGLVLLALVDGSSGGAPLREQECAKAGTRKGCERGF